MIEPSYRAQIYKLYKLLAEDEWIIWARVIMLLLCATIGILFTLNIPSVSLFNTLAVQVAGVLAALYMVSSVIGVWYFILKFEERNKIVVDLANSKNEAGQRMQQRYGLDPTSALSKQSKVGEGVERG